MNRNSKLAAVVVAIVIGTAGCATSFTGSPHVGGPGECQARCNTNMMDFAGMVYMGEYTSGCICRARTVAAVAQGGSAEESDSFAAVAAAPAAVGVVMQMRRAAAAHHY